MKSKALIPLLFALTSAGFAQGEEAKIIDPKAKAVLVKGLDAVGSKEDRARIKTRSSRGTVELPEQGMSMALEIEQKAPLMYYTKMVIPEVMTVEQGFDGKEGWTKDSIQGSRKLAGAELAQAKEGAAMFLEQQVLDELVSAGMLPETKDGEQTFTVVATSLKDGTAKTLSFDKDTGLLTRITTKAAVGPGGEMAIDMVASDYKEIDDIKIPHTIAMTVGPQKVVMKFSEIKHNAKIDDELFKMKK